MNVDAMIEKMNNAERIALENACAALRGYENDIQNYLAHIVASLCNVDVKDMLTDCNTLGVSQARWLYWYAYRLMTHNTYNKISEQTSKYYGKRFTQAAVANGITKISQIIEKEPIWEKRWMVVKKIIKQQQDFMFGFEKQPIKIVVPKGINIELKKE